MSAAYVIKSSPTYEHLQIIIAPNIFTENYLLIYQASLLLNVQQKNVIILQRPNWDLFDILVKNMEWLKNFCVKKASTAIPVV
jgi:hypothetical protein